MIGVRHPSNKKNLFWALLTALAFIIFDQFTKRLAVVHVKPVRSLSIISINGREILNFTYLQNTGAAFSILQGKQLFLIVITGIFIALLLYLLIAGKIKSGFMIWATSLVIAGGAGNLIDRVFNGYVVDFIDLRIIKFAVFNVADICAVIGALMMLVSIMFENNGKNLVASEKTQFKANSFSDADSEFNPKSDR
ncbi:MAG: signal peptidase II [Eubacterium sp.]|jgi:signal peptidase II|nr:signal peptidase II [Eubacterium sp.]